MSLVACFCNSTVIIHNVDRRIIDQEAYFIYFLFTMSSGLRHTTSVAWEVPATGWLSMPPLRLHNLTAGLCRDVKALLTLVREPSSFKQHDQPTLTRERGRKECQSGGPDKLPQWAHTWGNIVVAQGWDQGAFASFSFVPAWPSYCFDHSWKLATRIRLLCCFLVAGSIAEERQEQ